MLTPQEILRQQTLQSRQLQEQRQLQQAQTTAQPQTQEYDIQKAQTELSSLLSHSIPNVPRDLMTNYSRTGVIPKGYEKLVAFLSTIPQEYANAVIEGGGFQAPISRGGARQGTLSVNIGGKTYFGTEKFIQEKIAQTQTKQAQKLDEQYRRALAEQGLKKTNLGIYDIETKTYYDERTGMPIGEYTSGEKPNILSKLRYVSSKEYTRQMQGGQPTILGTIKQVGAGLLYDVGSMGAGLVQIATHPVQTIKNIPQAIKYAPKTFESIGRIARQEPAFFTGVVAGEVLTLYGVSQVAKIPSKVSKVLGYPKYETRFLSAALARNEQAQSILFKTEALTTEKGLLSKKRFISGSINVIRTGEEAKGIIPFESGTLGVFREYAPSLPTGKIKYSKPTGFLGRGQGTIIPKDIDIFLGTTPEGLRISKPLQEAIQFQGLTATALKGGKRVQYSIFAGVSAQVPEVENLFFAVSKDVPLALGKKGIKILKTGRGYSFGFFKDEIEQIINAENMFFGKTALTPKPFVSKYGARSVTDILRDLETTKPIQELPKPKIPQKLTEEILKANTKAEIQNALRLANEERQALQTFIGKGVSTALVSIPSPPIALPSVTKESLLFGGKQFERTEEQQIQMFKQPTAQKRVSAGAIRSILQVKESTLERLAQPQRYSTAQKQQQKQLTRMTQRIMQRQQTRFKPIVLPIITTQKQEDKSVLKSLLGKMAKTFDVSTWIGGKEKIIAKGLTEGRAKKFGAEYVRKTLRASFKLKPKGYTLMKDLKDIYYKLPLDIWTTSKKDINRFVQRRGKRLSAGTEVSEIISAKRKKKMRAISWW